MGLDFEHPGIALAVDLEGNARGTDVSYTATAAQSAALEEGVYDVWSTSDCYLKVATDASDVTTSSGYLLRANVTISLVVRKNKKIGAIRASADGTLSFHKVG